MSENVSPEKISPDCIQLEQLEWDKYIIYKPAIGRGTYSKVYRGIHKETKQNIAMKKIQFSKLHNNVKDKVISEINILQKMNHDNIMKMYEYKFDGEFLLLITEYCKDGDLEQWIARKENQNIETKINIIKQITTGIDYMHKNNIYHRDIKLQNILLHNNTVKICDFGFSIIIKEMNMMCNTICGTPLFMSPELLFLKPYTVMSEIWALGILYYMLIYNVHPFGKLLNLNDYRVKINHLKMNSNYIQYNVIPDIMYIVDIIKLMLQYNMDSRPTINVIMKMLNKEEYKENMLLQVDNNTMIEIVQPSIKPINNTLIVSPIIKPINNTLIVSPIIKPMNTISNMSPIIKPMDEISFNRIHELEEEVFRLESIIKEKELNRSSLYCCFDTEDNESNITGRGRTNNGYEKMTIDTEYFTPPDINASPIKGISSQSSSYSSSYGKSKSFLSSSIDKITSFFMRK